MEFTDIMEEAKRILDSRPMRRKLAPGERYMVSYDNDRVHQGADLTEVGIMDEDRFELPELSSDMHKVVEHVHAWLQFRMQQWLETQENNKLTVRQCMDELERLFYKELKLESIRKDVHSLKATYKAVIDHQGGYIPAADR